MTDGAVYLNSKGRRMVAPSGKADVKNENLYHSCCCCKPYTLKTFTTELEQEKFDLTEYQGNGVAEPDHYWRVTNNYTGYVPTVFGCVDENGQLVGLPDSVSSDAYKYTWVFRLEIGCKDETGNYIVWPAGSKTNIFSCE
jgi:hypothetical protein